MPRFVLAALVCLALTLVTAPGALAATNITVVAGGAGANVNNSGPPTFTPTGANSQIGVDQINTQLQAGTDVTLNTSPDFGQSGTITINAAISSANAAGDLTLDGDSLISQSAAVSVVGNTHVVTNGNEDVTLTNAGNNFNTFSSGLVATLSLTDTNAITFGELNVNSGMAVTAGGNVTQASGKSAFTTGDISFNVGANDVDMDNAGNLFSSVAFIANDVAVADSNGSLGLNASTITGNLTASTPVGLFQNSPNPVSVGGTATLSAGVDVELTDAGNNWATVAVPTANNVSLVDVNAVALDSISAASLSVTAGDPITQTVGSALAIGGNAHFVTNTSDNVTVANASNNFGSVSTGQVDSLSVTDSDALTLGAINANGVLTVNTGGSVTQTAPIGVSGGATFNVGSANDVTLTDPGNFFSSVAFPSANNVAVVDATGLVLSGGGIGGTLSVTTSGGIFDNGPVSVAGTTTLSAGVGNDITLNEPATDLSTVVINSATNATIIDADDLVLGTTTVAGALTLNAGGPLTQSGAATVPGDTNATAAPVTLDHAGNDFGGAVALTSSGANQASVRDAGDLTLDSSGSGGALSATAGDDLVVPAGETVAATGPLALVADAANPTAPAIGTGGVLVDAGAALTGSGAIRLYGAHRSDNAISGTATFNGATFTPGSLFVQTPREQWGVYSPAGTATAPFTFFYKEADASTPQATITSPADGATFERGQTVNAAYSCTDGGGNTGVTKCDGTVASGSAIDTATLGQKTFKVDVQNGAGNQSTRTISYTVVDTTEPTITVTSPANGGTYTLDQALVADYACADETNLVSCTGTVADGAAIDTSSVGTKTFTVVADDGSSNAAAVTVNYTVEYPAGNCVLSQVGTDVVDTLVGTRAGDALFGRAGGDTLRGGPGDDCVYGEEGDDVLWGGVDNDQVSGGDGNDELHGRAGDDSVRGGDGDDYLAGRDGADRLKGNSGDDRLRGQQGNDTLKGGEGDDSLNGGAGDNTYSAGGGNDVIRARNGTSETIRCGSGRDVARIDDSDHTRGCEVRRTG